MNGRMTHSQVRPHASLSLVPIAFPHTRRTLNVGPEEGVTTSAPRQRVKGAVRQPQPPKLPLTSTAVLHGGVGLEMDLMIPVVPRRLPAVTDSVRRSLPNMRGGGGGSGGTTPRTQPFARTPRGRRGMQQAGAPAPPSPRHRRVAHRSPQRSPRRPRSSSAPAPVSSPRASTVAPGHGKENRAVDAVSRRMVALPSIVCRCVR